MCSAVLEPTWDDKDGSTRHGDKIMKALLATAALLGSVIAGSPTMAQTMGDGARAAFAQVEPGWRASVRRGIATNRYYTPDGRMHSSNGANDVYDGPDYVGSDPDAFIRNDLVRGDNRGD
jgi:hypothetical protein